jgi:hypothetical protein
VIEAKSHNEQTEALLTVQEVERDDFYLDRRDKKSMSATDRQQY